MSCMWENVKSSYDIPLVVKNKVEFWLGGGFFGKPLFFWEHEDSHFFVIQITPSKISGIRVYENGSSLEIVEDHSITLD